MCADLTVFTVFHGPTTTSRSHQERVKCGENPTKNTYNIYMCKYSSNRDNPLHQPQLIKKANKKMKTCYQTSNRCIMQTHQLTLQKPKLSYLKRLRVILPSFLHQLQNNHVGQSFLKQLITKQDKKKSNYKAVRLSKKIVFFFQVYFQMGGLFFFFLPTHTLRDFSEGQKVGQGKI